MREGDTGVHDNDPSEKSDGCYREERKTRKISDMPPTHREAVRRAVALPS
jgi:hypothetical protein